MLDKSVYFNFCTLTDRLAITGHRGIPGPKGYKGEPGKYLNLDINSLLGIKGVKGHRGRKGESGLQGHRGITVLPSRVLYILGICFFLSILI